MVDLTLPRKCEVERCGGVHYAKGLCASHYEGMRALLKKVGKEWHILPEEPVPPVICEVDGCGTVQYAKRLCHLHYHRKFRTGRVEPVDRVAKKCSVEGCDRKYNAHGLCGMHYQRYKKYGTTDKQRPYGEGSVVDGYRLLFRPGHPNAQKDGKIAEHRFVMAELLGRPLLPNENVHHLNGDRLDNRAENLELWVRTQPCGQRPVDLVTWAHEILRVYGSLIDG